MAVNVHAEPANQEAYLTSFGKRQASSNVRRACGKFTIPVAFKAFCEEKQAITVSRALLGLDRVLVSGICRA